MDLVEKYYQKVNDLIEEAKVEGVTIAPYSREIRTSEGSFEIEGGITIMQGDNYMDIPTWRK